jgi:hydroxylamine oxidation protein HaoB
MPARPGNKLLPLLGILLVTGGFLLLAWFAYLWFNPKPAPYQYQLVAEGGVDKFAELRLQDWPDLSLRKYEVRVPEVDAPIAVMHVASRGSAVPVLLSWEGRISEPVVALDSRLSELTTLAGAIAKHAPKDALILSWWDTSRQLRLLAGSDTLFNAHVGEPLIIPAQWHERSDVIRQYEDKFWGAPASADERRKFQRFADALVANADAGAAILRELAGPREAYLVVHVTDLYKLGLLRPDHFDMAYKVFPMGGNMHGLIGYLKGWMRDNHYETYALQSISDSEVRAFFLKDAKSSNTLLAQTLPFTNTQPLDLAALQLVYQHGGYWLYKVPASTSGKTD